MAHPSPVVDAAKQAADATAKTAEKARGGWQRLPPIERYGLRLTLFGVALTLVGIPFGLLLEQVVFEGPLTRFDLNGAVWINRRVHSSDGALAVMRMISFIGKPIFLTPVVGIPALWLFFQRRYKLVIFLAATSLGGGAVDTVVKIAVGRPRPQVDEPVAAAFGNSFPSGHSMSSLVCYGAVLLVFIPLIPAALRLVSIVLTSLLVFAIGLSRLALGVHFVSDVAGGYVLGAAWLIASVAAFEVWREDRGRRHTKPLSEGVEPEETKDLHVGKASSASR